MFFNSEFEKEEAYLNEMSKKGLHFVSRSYLGWNFRFRKGEPKDYLYKLDYQVEKNIDRAEYLQVFQDMGWTHIEDHRGWSYFRKERSGNNSDKIYSSAKEIIDMVKIPVRNELFYTYLPILIAVILPNIFGFFSADQGRHVIKHGTAGIV